MQTATICSTRKNLELIKIDLPIDIRAVTYWFFENYMMLNSEKYHCMCIGKNCADDTFIHNVKKFKNSKEETILGVTIDNKLTFSSRIKKVCNKAG